MIAQVRLTNFKSFADTEDADEGTVVDLEAFTLVLGTNGAGKSNFFDALRLLRSIGEGRSVRDALEGHALPGAQGAAVAEVRGGAASIPHQGSSSPVFRLAVQMLIGGEGYEYVVRVDALRHRVMAENLWKRGHPGDYVYATHPDVAPLQQDDDGPTIAARVYRNTRGVNPRSEFSPHEFLLGQLPARRGTTVLNSEVAERVLAELSAITLLELRPEVLRQYSPPLASVGTAGARTLVVEELENWMNPTRIALLMATLHQATQAGDDVQVIASTHSPAVLDLVPQEVREAAVVMGWDDELGASRPVRVMRLRSIERITRDTSLGQLQTEGWLQEAAAVSA